MAWYFGRAKPDNSGAVGPWDPGPREMSES
jgi:hypothetical protein